MDGTSLRELIHISRTLGSDRKLVWKGGGNISIKTNEAEMFIKASGSELGRMTRTRGWRKVDVAKVNALLTHLLGSKTTPAKITKGLLECCCDGLDSTAMPSIETFFHALLGRCVVHLHPVYLLPYLCSQAGKELLQAALGQLYAFQWIPFRGLGVVTAGQIQRHLRSGRLDHQVPTLVLLSNHGLIVSCDSAEQARQVVGAVIQLCRKHLPVLKPVCLPQRNQLSIASARIRNSLGVQGSLMGVKPISGNRIRTPDGLSPQREWFKGIITPEEMTYLAGGIVWIEQPESKVIQKAITRHQNKTGRTPMAFYVNQQGLVLAADKKHISLYQEVFLFYLQIRGWAMRMNGLKPLPAKYLTPEGMI